MGSAVLSNHGFPFTGSDKAGTYPFPRDRIKKQSLTRISSFVILEQGAAWGQVTAHSLAAKQQMHWQLEQMGVRHVGRIARKVLPKTMEG